MDKEWEYLIGYNLTLKDLNHYGENGWELVSAICVMGTINNFTFYFKREKRGR